MTIKKILFALSLLLLLSPAYAQISGGKGSYEFQLPPSFGEKKMEVYYYRPLGDVTTMPILFVMHGMLRNADVYRDNWVELADKHKILVVVPRFTQEDFKGDRGYAFGNVQAKGGKLNDPSIWSFSLMDKIFDDVVTQTKSKQKKYDLFGHSAGSQFCHRFVLFMQKNKADRIIAANAGSYTILDENVNYPFGIKDLGIDDNRLKALLQKDFVVQLGDKDTDPNHSQLPKSVAAMKQGSNRFERGHYFYEKAKKQAERLGVSLNWKIRIVKGAAHQNSKMAADAAKYLYGE